MALIRVWKEGGGSVGEVERGGGETEGGFCRGSC